MTTTQRTDVGGLSVVSASTTPAWFTGTSEDGVDARLELATLIAASDSGDRVAVRDARHPGGPALLFSLPAWNALHGREPDRADGIDLVDLR